MNTFFTVIALLLAAPASPVPESGRACAVACRCGCDAARECPCGPSCPVAVLHTGSLSERAWVPARCLERRTIDCPPAGAP